MKDITYHEFKITNDYVNIMFKLFRKLRFGLNNITRKDIDPELAGIRWELLQWQLQPGTDRSLFSNTTIYCGTILRPEYYQITDLIPQPGTSSGNGSSTTDENIIRIIDDIPDYN